MVCTITIFPVCVFLFILKVLLGDAIGNCAAAALIGPSGRKCCWYCNIEHLYLHYCKLQDLSPEELKIAHKKSKSSCCALYIRFAQNTTVDISTPHGWSWLPETS